MPRRTRSDAPTPSPMAASTCSAIATSGLDPDVAPRRDDSGVAAIDWHRDPVHGRVAPALFWSEVPYLDPACGDHKIIWELNRHQHFLVLGRAWWLAGHGPARATFVRHLAGWMDANPPLVGINWASMLELALRSLSWIWALELFVEPAAGDDPRDDQPIDAHPWLVDLLLGLDRQLHLVEQNLSTYFSPNTHLLGEALALYVAGRTLPELRRAPAWAELGRRILIEEMSRQISPDGGHVERSFHYHRYTLDFYLLALAVARLTGDDTRPFAEAARRLARFARTIADDRGHLARIGDDDGGQLFPICGRDSADASDTLALAAWLLGDPSLAVGPAPEETAWMSGGGAVIAAARRTADADPLDDARRQRLHRLPHRARRSPGARHRAARISERRPCPRRRLVDDADRGRPAAPRRPRHGLLHDRSVAPRSLPLDAPAQHAGPRRARAVGARRPVPLGLRGRRIAPGVVHVAGLRLRRGHARRLRAAGPPPRRVLAAGLLDRRRSRAGRRHASGRGALASRSALDRHRGRRRVAAAPTMAPAIPSGWRAWTASSRSSVAATQAASPASAGSRRPTATSCPAPRCGSSVAARRPSRW